MPSFVTPSRRPRDEISDDEDDEDVRTPSSGSSRGSKRLRQHRANGEPSTIHQYQLTNGHQTRVHNGEPLANGTTSKAPLVHQPGSIVRVKLENFVTYASGEFFPGPSLNMVIGPNGTGKSTLVCAICLGLGWGPQHLGRAKEISEFVKHGAHEATIEIELCRDGRKFKRNPVIRCIIKKEGNKSLWTLNGRSSNKKEVQGVAKSFSIQIDNLCQFLPQDRVVEFAAMSPVELLRSTQRAVASQAMIDWHEELIGMRKDQRDVENANIQDRETLANLESRQRMQEADVQRLREREGVKERIRLLVAARPVAHYAARRQQYQRARQQKDAAERDLKNLEASVEPALRAANAKQAYRGAVQAAREDRQKAVKDAERRAEEKSKKIEDLQSKVDRFGAEAEREKKDAKTSRSDIKRIDGILTNLQRQLDQGPGGFDVTGVNEHIRENERRFRTLSEEIGQLQEQVDNCHGTGRELDTKVQRTEQELRNLDSQAGKRQSMLARINRDTARAWEWVQQNQTEFSKPILGPPIVECSVKDSRYVDMIETLIQPGDMITLTAQTKDDQKKLHDIIKNKLNCHRTNTRCALPLERYPPPMNNDQREALGLEGWAIDYLQGPPQVLAMLCEAAGINRTGVTFEDINAQRFQQLRDSTLSQFVTSKSVYRIIRRKEYGPGAVSTTVRDLKKAQLWTNQPVDMAMKRELSSRISNWQKEKENANRQIGELTEQMNRLTTKTGQLKEDQDRLKTEKTAKQKAAQTFNSLPVRIAQQEDKRRDCQEVLDGVREKLEEIESKQNDVKLEKARAAVSYAESVEALQRSFEAVQEAEIMLIEAQSDLETLERNNTEIRDQLKTKRTEVKDLAHTLKRAKDEAQTSLAAVQKMKEEADDALSAFLETYDSSQTMEQLEDEIESERSRLELGHEGDSNVIVQYEERERRITKLKEKLERVSEALREIGGKIAEVRQKWEPKLDKLIKRISESFSYNMQQINCNGEVDVHKVEDFDEWAIIIHVRFREHEPLTRLDSHRQSGGERAVSTIFYLMSLQSLTKSPFRVVDEINQGMDPRNERLVHARMVAIATGNDDWRPQQDELEAPRDTRRGEREEDEEDDEEADGAVDVEDAESIDGEIERDARVDLGAVQGSQYFLVTPKLLHDLRYEEGMTVLCIVSGEHLLDPEQGVELISFKRSLEIRRRLNGKVKGKGKESTAPVNGY